MLSSDASRHVRSSLLLLLCGSSLLLASVLAATMNGDLIGVYEKVDGLKFLDTSQCPSTLRSSTFVFDQYVDDDFSGFGFFNIRITHRTTKIGSSECKSSGSIYVVESDHPTVKNKSAIIEDWATGHRSKYRSYMAHEEFVQIAPQERFLYGYDFVERNCGSSTIRAGAVYLWIEPSFTVHIHNSYELEKGNKYLLITYKNWKANQGCLYQASEVGGSSDNYPSGPTADPSRKKGFKPRKTSRDADESPDAEGDDEEEEDDDDSGDSGNGDVFSGGKDGGSDGNGKACFPAHATVRLADGSSIRMDQLQVGQSVAVSPARSTESRLTSDVFLFSHRDSGIQTRFLSLITESGHKLTVSPGHYVYINGHLAAALSARVGDKLLLADGSASSIVRVTSEMHLGLYNPQTIHGDIIVDGVVVSTYTTAVQPSVASLLLAPARALYNARLGSLLVGVFDKGANNLAAWLPAGSVVI